MSSALPSRDFSASLNPHASVFSAGKAGQQMLGAFLKLLSEPTSNIPQEWEAPLPRFLCRDLLYADTFQILFSP